MVLTDRSTFPYVWLISGGLIQQKTCLNGSGSEQAQTSLLSCRQDLQCEKMIIARIVVILSGEQKCH